VLEHKSGNISKTRKDRAKDTIHGVSENRARIIMPHKSRKCANVDQQFTKWFSVLKAASASVCKVVCTHCCHLLCGLPWADSYY